MNKERVFLNCGADRAELYLEAIDGFPSDIYSDRNIKFKITVNYKAAVFIPDLPEGEYCNLKVPTEGISNAEVLGGRNALRFRKGDFAYEARSSSEKVSNDGNGKLEKLSDSGTKD